MRWFFILMIGLVVMGCLEVTEPTTSIQVDNNPPLETNSDSNTNSKFTNPDPILEKRLGEIETIGTNVLEMLPLGIVQFNLQLEMGLNPDMPFNKVTNYLAAISNIRDSLKRVARRQVSSGVVQVEEVNARQAVFIGDNLDSFIPYSKLNHFLINRRGSVESSQLILEGDWIKGKTSDNALVLSNYLQYYPEGYQLSSLRFKRGGAHFSHYSKLKISNPSNEYPSIPEALQNGIEGRIQIGNYQPWRSFWDGVGVGRIALISGSVYEDVPINDDQITNIPVFFDSVANHLTLNFHTEDHIDFDYNDSYVTIVIHGLRGGYRYNLAGLDLRGSNLSGLNLNGADLSYANLNYANLSYANLSNVNLQSANLLGANLVNADLRGANLTNVSLPSSANLSNVHLSREGYLYFRNSGSALAGLIPNLSFADLSSTDLMDARLWFANLSNANFSNVNLSRSVLWAADLGNANLVGADLREAGLVGANLSNANVKGADLRGADLRSTLLTGADLAGADFRDTDLRTTIDLRLAVNLRLANLSGVNLSEFDLSGINLNNVNLSNANLSYVNLSNANLLDASLVNADLRGANLTNVSLPSSANLSNVHLSREGYLYLRNLGYSLAGLIPNLSFADLSSTDLREARLWFVNMSNANFSNVNLSRAVLWAADLGNVNLVGADLRDAGLVAANLRGANVRGADLRGADLRGADLNNANLSNANLSSANLSNANLSNVNLTNANLTNANLTDIKVSEEVKTYLISIGFDVFGVNLAGADLSGTDLTSSNLSNANLANVNLSNANLSNANLSGADLSSANLFGANLMGVSLSGAVLSNANLSYSDLRGANFSGANFSSANLNGALLSQAGYAYLTNHNNDNAFIFGPVLVAIGIAIIDLFFFDGNSYPYDGRVSTPPDNPVHPNDFDNTVPTNGLVDFTNVVDISDHSSRFSGYVVSTYYSHDSAGAFLYLPTIGNLGSSDSVEYTLSVNYDNDRNGQVRTADYGPVAEVNDTSTFNCNGNPTCESSDWYSTTTFRRPAGHTVIGGNATITGNGHSVKFKIKGINPSAKQVKQAIGYNTVQKRLYRAIVKHESDFKQFNNSNQDNAYEPNWGTPNGWGVGQLDPPSDSSELYYSSGQYTTLGKEQARVNRWYWYSNVTKGYRRFVEDKYIPVCRWKALIQANYSHMGITVRWPSTREVKRELSFADVYRTLNDNQFPNDVLTAENIFHIQAYNGVVNRTIQNETGADLSIPGCGTIGMGKRIRTPWEFDYTFDTWFYTFHPNENEYIKAVHAAYRDAQ